MSEEKLYAVKNDEGKYCDCEYEKFLLLSDAYCPAIVSEDNAKAIARDSGGHVVALIEEPEKVVLTKKQAEIVENARDEEYPATYISNNSDVGASGEEKLLMEAFVNGYTVVKEKKYLVYKVLGGKQKHELFAQAYRPAIFPDTITWSVGERRAPKTGVSAQFSEAEIEHYGLQDCEKEEVTDDAD